MKFHFVNLLVHFVLESFLLLVEFLHLHFVEFFQQVYVDVVSELQFAQFSLKFLVLLFEFLLVFLLEHVLVVIVIVFRV